MPAASLLDAVIRVGRCVSLMMRVRERCYGLKFAPEVLDRRRCFSSEREVPDRVSDDVSAS